MMRLCLAIAGLVLAAAASRAETPDLDSLRWTARPLVVFADAPDDPRFTQQMARLEADPAPLPIALSPS